MITDENVDDLQSSRLRKSVQEKEVRFASEDMIPKITKPNYHTEPATVRLCRMSEQELSQVEDFSIENEFGKIIFDGKTDIRGLNLDELINIKSKAV